MIKFENVSKVYPNGYKGLKNVSLEIEQGEFVAIIGLSGAGKSTLVRFIIEALDVEKDKGLKNNIANEQKQITQKHIEFTQAFIQQYNNTIIENKTMVSK